MELIYKSEMGEVILKGVGNEHFNICSVEGLDLIEKERELQSYTGEDGMFEKSSRYTMRIINISGDFKNDPDNLKIKNAIRALSKKGILTVKSGNCEREIEVNSATFTVGENYGKYTRFVIGLVCDYPHFKDTVSSQYEIFKKENYLTSTSTFPLVLSKRVSKGTLVNSGDLDVYPVIRIEKNSDLSSNNSISVTNHTTGQSIVLDKKMSFGEEIVIDVTQRTITSSIDGNILGTLSLYSSLSNMKLVYGENLISVELDGEQTGISVDISFKNEYLEAI